MTDLMEKARFLSKEARDCEPGHPARTWMKRQAHRAERRSASLEIEEALIEMVEDAEAFLAEQAAIDADASYWEERYYQDLYDEYLHDEEMEAHYAEDFYADEHGWMFGCEDPHCEVC